MEIFLLIIKCLLGGIAAVGFAILFNVPERALWYIAGMGAVLILVKTVLMDYFGVSIILASFIASVAVGILAIYSSHIKKSPPLVFAVPSVIPGIPGIFIYKTMIGMIKLSGETGEEYHSIMESTLNNGLKATFIVGGLAIGVILPNLLLRKESFKRARK